MGELVAVAVDVGEGVPVVVAVGVSLGVAVALADGDDVAVAVAETMAAGCDALTVAVAVGGWTVMAGSTGGFDPPPLKRSTPATAMPMPATSSVAAMV